MFAIDSQTTGPNWLTFFRKPVGNPGGGHKQKRIWKFLKFHRQRWARLL